MPAFTEPTGFGLNSYLMHSRGKYKQRFGSRFRMSGQDRAKHHLAEFGWMRVARIAIVAKKNLLHSEIRSVDRLLHLARKPVHPSGRSEPTTCLLQYPCE